jgi:hypothetical protein
VQINASGWIRSSAMGGGQNKYNTIAGGWTYVTIAHVTGAATTWSTMSNEAALVKAVTTSKMVALGSKSSPSVSGVDQTLFPMAF